MSHNVWILRLFSYAIAGILCLGTGLSASLAAGGDKVLAKIGNETIKESDLKEMADAVPERFRYLYTTEQGRKQTLEYIVNVYALAAEAEKEGVAQTDKFKKLMTLAKKDLLARLYLESKKGSAPAVTEAEAKAFYDKHKDQFKTPESVHLRHVLVNSEDQAKKVMDKLKKGQNFADIAAKESICPSKARGGDLDWLPKGRLVKEVEDAAFSMKKGEVVGPIKSKFGYHVLLLEDKKPASTSTFDETKDYIMEQLDYRNQQKQYEKLATDARKKFNVQIMADSDTPTAKPGAPAGGPKAKPKN